MQHYAWYGLGHFFGPLCSYLSFSHKHWHARSAGAFFPSCQQVLKQDTWLLNWEKRKWLLWKKENVTVYTIGASLKIHELGGTAVGIDTTCLSCW
jgi:hypothetical protein